MWRVSPQQKRKSKTKKSRGVTSCCRRCGGARARVCNRLDAVDIITREKINGE